jgi:hypothetical protein
MRKNGRTSDDAERAPDRMRGWGARTARSLTVGTTGFALSVTLLMVLSPMSAGVGVHPNAVVMKAPYKGTASMARSFPQMQGCYKQHGPGWVWSPLTGAINGSESVSAKVCPKSVGYVGADSGIYTYNDLYVGIPLKAGLVGNRSIDSAWTVQVARSQVYTVGGCPAKVNINYNPPYGTDNYAFCLAYAAVIFEEQAYVVDLQNGSWYSNFSSVESYNESSWWNYTECYNYSGAYCTNTTGPLFNNTGQYGSNAPGFGSSFAWGTKTSYQMWTNGTNMVRTHHYMLFIDMFFEVFSEADAYNVAGHWHGAAAASMNMATLGNGATIQRITIT